jgi:hypothetical protein
MTVFVKLCCGKVDAGGACRGECALYIVDRGKSEHEMQQELERQFVTHGVFAIGPDSFRRGWRAAIAWIEKEKRENGNDTERRDSENDR